MQVEDDSTTVDINALSQPLADYPLGPYVVGGLMRKKLLDTLLAKRIQYEANVWLPRHLKQVAERPSASSPPPYLFIYQEVMALLGASPAYFAPTSLVSRAVFLFYSMSRYLFGALFLGIVVRVWSPPPAEVNAA